MAKGEKKVPNKDDLYDLDLEIWFNVTVHHLHTGSFRGDGGGDGGVWIKSDQDKVVQGEKKYDPKLDLKQHQMFYDLAKLQKRIFFKFDLDLKTLRSPLFGWTGLFLGPKNKGLGLSIWEK